MTRRLVHPFVSALVGVAIAVPAFAGNQIYDFNVGGNPESGDPASVPGFILFGNQAGGIYQYFDGNPGDSGYLALTSAGGSQSAGILFPDVDLYTNSLGNVVSLPVKAFRIEMDVRLGNGNRRPADGFSISFCRTTDPALERAQRNPPAFGGWAGGDSLAATADLGDAGNPEQGTHTGLAVCFDTWAGNWLPANGVITNSASANDVEGIYVRLDDVTLVAVPFGANQATRNGGCYITELNAGDPCGGTVCTNVDTMQTGPWTGPSANGTGDGAASDATYNNLCWARFTAEVNELKQVTVTYKGRVILDHFQLANYPTSQGRLILAGRTGGNYQQTHIDNVTVTTTPAVQPVFQGVAGNIRGFQINFLNIGLVAPTNLSRVLLDGVNVASQTVISNYLDVSTHGIYTQVDRFAARSAHTVVVEWQDSLGQMFTNSANFNAGQYIDLAAANAIPLAQIDTSKPGFKVKSYQSLRYQPNSLNWTEEQVIGLRGPNVANQSAAVNGYFDWPGVPHFSNGAGGNLFPGTTQPFTVFGIGDGTPPAPLAADNSALELFGYIYFPTSGVYTMYFGSDDGYRLSFAANTLDRLGQEANFFNGGRGLGEPGDQFLIFVDQPGCYPARMLWENGGGGADFQWLTGQGDDYAQINDVSDPDSLLVYAEALPAANLGAYLRSANPVNDAGNVVFYQPIVVELGNGSGTRTVNQGSIVLSVDGVNQTLTTTTPQAGVTRIVSQMGGNAWSVGRHTNVLTFADNAGSNYVYSWPFTVINVPSTNVVAIPAANGVPAGAVDASKPGFRIKTWQSPHDNPNHLSWTEMQLQGLKGMNVADQSGTFGTGYFEWGNTVFGAESDGILDLRYSSGTGAGGEWGYNAAYSPTFGIGNNAFITGTGLNAWRFNFAANQAESSAMDIGFWLVFPAAGTYILHANSDDGLKMLAPVGSPFNKLGTVLMEANVGRGVAGSSGGQVGGDYRAISIPNAGAYPFRIVYENGGTDGGIEFSIYQFLPNGGVAKVPVNSLNDPNSIKAYQTLTAGDTTAPYVSYANPPHNHQEATYWQPVVVELTDGPGTKLVNDGTIVLTVDGIVRNTTISNPSAGVTRVVQNLSPTTWSPGTHNVTLAFSDNDGTAYNYAWTFNVITLTPFQNNQPGVVVDVPASSMVPIASVDHNQPGFRVYTYQSGSQGIGNVEEAERAFLGERGANIAILDPMGYYVHNDVVDFADGYNHNPGFTGYDGDEARGEFRFNYPFSRFGGQPKGGGNNTNDIALIFAGYMEFPTAGVYAMTVNSDDGFKATVPFANPRGQPGTILGWFNGGRGITTGTGFGPRGNVTHFVFRIPTPGAYPIRLLWQNGGGGLDLEWTVYQFLPDGSVARTVVGDTNAPGALKVYQTSSESGPYVTSMNPGLPYTLVGNGLQVMTLGRNGNLSINLQDGSTTVDTSSIILTVNGVAQPITVTQPGAGVTTVSRFGTNTLPSGVYGPAVLTYKDNLGRTFNVNWTLFSSDFNGTVLGGYPLGSGDATKPGFLWRTFQVDGAGGVNMPTRIHVAEQVLAGIWTNNHANLTSNTVNGYFVLHGSGENGSNGLVNFNQDSPGNSGRFNSGNGFIDQPIPGIPGFKNTRQTDSIVGEALAYVEFPTAGSYLMGIASDDGFRVTRGWGAAAQNGALIVNTPAGIAGKKAAVLSSMVSQLLTNAISGEIVQALGTGSGSSNPIEACGITNAAALAGKIALLYRGTCGFNAKVQNAVEAGAIAVILVQDRPVTTPGDGWFPTEMGIQPIRDIPAIMIKRADGDAIVAALANAPVTATLTPMDDLVNPGASSPVLGQADIGKGDSDVFFTVTVPEAGVYPLRALWFEGGGGGNVEWYHSTDDGTTKILVNDANNPASLKAYYGLTVLPDVSLEVAGDTATIDYTGTLQWAPTVDGPWTDVYGQPPLVIETSQAASLFFRSR